MRAVWHHDTSVAMIEKTYSKHINDYTDTLNTAHTA
jgi:hypothetical protein